MSLEQHSGEWRVMWLCEGGNQFSRGLPRDRDRANKGKF